MRPSSSIYKPFAFCYDLYCYGGGGFRFIIVLPLVLFLSLALAFTGPTCVYPLGESWVSMHVDIKKVNVCICKCKFS